MKIEQLQENFNINESMGQKWKKQEDALCQVKMTKQSFRGHKARWPHLEDKNEQWVIEQRTAGRSIPTVSLRSKARATACDMKINDFQGGPSLCFCFVKRRNLSISMRTTMLQQLSNNYKEKLVSFRTYCMTKIREHKIQLKHITNTDEVTFDIPLNQTVKKAAKNYHPWSYSKGSLLKKKFPVGIVIKANPKGWMKR